jgi:hypothetical protein
MSKGDRVKSQKPGPGAPVGLASFWPKPGARRAIHWQPQGVGHMGSNDDYSKESRGECLKLSQQSADSVLKATWLRLADAWQKLACECEKRKAKKD